jgi:YgiT-type zinc finger domain-containing protein
MLDVCPVCKVKLKLVKKKRVFNFDNPGQIPIESDMYECPKCGEEFLDEKQSLSVSRKLDRAIEDERKVKAPAGSILV